ncbi:MAG: ATP-dependent Clp protease adaptor ClpS [Treponema sp.]|nr:ATP-dependent Clp protease adaptor ClpS [Treponema sp.]
MSNLSNQFESSHNSFTADADFPLPPEKNVVFYNDDFTTMEFVVDVLISVFNKSKENAEFLMNKVHEEGSAVVGTYTYDIAVSRVNLTRSLAKQNGFPLRVEIE